MTAVDVDAAHIDVEVDRLIDFYGGFEGCSLLDVSLTSQVPDWNHLRRRLKMDTDSRVIITRPFGLIIPARSLVSLRTRLHSHNIFTRIPEGNPAFAFLYSEKSITLWVLLSALKDVGVCIVTLYRCA